MHIRAKSASTTWKTVWVPEPKRFREKEPAFIFFRGEDLAIVVIFYIPPQNRELSASIFRTSVLAPTIQIRPMALWRKPAAELIPRLCVLA